MGVVPSLAADVVGGSEVLPRLHVAVASDDEEVCRRGRVRADIIGVIEVVPRSGRHVAHAWRRQCGLSARTCRSASLLGHACSQAVSLASKAAAIG